MRIALNLLYIVPDKVGGTQIYAESLLEALAQLDSQNEYFLFVAQEAADLPLPDAPNFQRVICPCRASSRIGRYLWEQLNFPSWLRRYKIDLVHSLGYVCPLFPPCKSVVSIHDINYVGLGYAMPRIRRRTLRFFVPASARRADHIITISHFSREQIVKFTGVPPEKVTVTHLAPGVRQTNQSEAVIAWNELASLYGLKRPYVVAFCAQSLHKNIERLAEQISASGLENQVIPTGFVPNEHVFPLLFHAELFAFPSWYEGFGMPVLEAQKAGLPMICSQAASLPEVAGKGAVYFNPKSTEEMAQALQNCLEDAQLRETLAAQARENVNQFSWEKTARATLEVYLKIGAGK
jgi:glycosyltransferase involved in cell wall biosynthesis